MDVSLGCRDRRWWWLISRTPVVVVLWVLVAPEAAELNSQLCVVDGGEETARLSVTVRAPPPGAALPSLQACGRDLIGRTAKIPAIRKMLSVGVGQHFPAFVFPTAPFPAIER